VVTKVAPKLNPGKINQLKDISTYYRNILILLRST